jgi:hypothetical protein
MSSHNTRMQAYLTRDMVSKCIPAGWSLYFRSF